MAERSSSSTVPRSTSRRKGEGLPVVLVHGLGLQGALWNRVCDGARVRATGSSGSTCAGRRALGRELERGRALARPVGRRSRRRARRPRARPPGDRRPLARRRRRAQVRARAPDDAPGARPDRRRGRTSPTSRRACSPRPSGSRELGLEAWIAGRVLVEEPAVLASNRSQRNPAMLGRVPRAAARERRGRLRAPVPCDRHRREPRRTGSARCRHPALVVIGGERRPHASRARPCARPARYPAPRLVELPDVGHTIPLEAPEATAEAIETFIAEVDAEAERGRARPPRRHDAAQLAGGAVRAPRRPLGRRPSRPVRR